MENKQLFDLLLSDYQVRKSKKQKLRFINFVKERCVALGLSCQIDEGKKWVYNRNIVVGDLNKARVIFTAHYDTCAWIPIPNFFAKNLIFYILYTLFFAGLLIAASRGMAFLVTSWISNAVLADTIYRLVNLVILFALLFQVMFGFPNKHTANDNTSGVATLLSLMHRMSAEERDKVAFVFFDNEEFGLFGSSMFMSWHGSEIAATLLINFDCVSDGNHLLFVSKKLASGTEKFPLLKNILEDNAVAFKKIAVFSSALRTFSPSDQILFPKSIGVMALKKMPVIGLYCDRIHTSMDTRFDTQNIEFLTNSFKKFVSQI